MNWQTTTALAIGLTVVAVVAGAAAVATPDDASDATENTSETMTETEFPWGTVVHEVDPETGETNVNVIVEAESDVSVSTVSAPDATADYRDEPTTDDADAETETFSWGIVKHTIDPDTDATDVEVIVDTGDDVAISVTTVSGDGTQESTSRITSASETSGSGDASVTQSTVSSTSSSSSSTTISSTNVVRSSNGTEGESTSIDIDSDDG